MSMQYRPNTPRPCYGNISELKLAKSSTSTSVRLAPLDCIDTIFPDHDHDHVDDDKIWTFLQDYVPHVFAIQSSRSDLSLTKKTRSKNVSTWN